MKVKAKVFIVTNDVLEINNCTINMEFKISEDYITYAGIEDQDKINEAARIFIEDEICDLFEIELFKHITVVTISVEKEDNETVGNFTWRKIQKDV